eukprot:Opistho-2@58231
MSAAHCHFVFCANTTNINSVQLDRPVTNVDNPPFKACGKGRVRACFRGEITFPSTAPDKGTVLRVYCDNSSPSSDRIVRFHVSDSDETYEDSSGCCCAADNVLMCLCGST